MDAKYNKYNIEELKFNLPDYISNNISDNELSDAIENELKINPDLRKDLDELKNTFSFLETSEFAAPPVNYFSNLPVKINQRINTNEQPKGFLDRLSLFWKILIPSIPAIIIICIILFNSLKDDSTEIMSGNRDPVKKELIQKETDPVENKNKITDKLSDDSKEKTFKNEIHKKNNIKRSIHPLRNNNVSEDLTNLKSPDTAKLPQIPQLSDELLADNIESNEDSNNNEETDILYINEEGEDEDLNDEFLNFTPAEQQEIIDNLIKAQI
ncbi:MAG: hypothetical protein ABIY50_12825 [Ignavibacteria bacterium]